jgi:hypothetical protein
VPTGITLKPSDNQMREFGKRAKTLDREAIFKILWGKLEGYRDMIDGNNVKVLIVML